MRFIKYLKLVRRKLKKHFRVTIFVLHHESLIENQYVLNKFFGV